MGSLLPATSGSCLALSSVRCRPCIATVRAFSQAPPSRVAPESPAYIEIPKPIQERYPPRRRVKGILPIPREIFPTRGRNKTTPQYFAAVTPEPSSTNTVESTPAGSKHADYSGWKRRMAATRRQNLRESLVELQKRKSQHVYRKAVDHRRKRSEREELVHRPQREDERLTSPTITETIRQLQIGPAPDPDRMVRLAEMKARVERKQAEKEEQRQSALHTLYMQARNFITTESQLNEQIERIFVKHPRQFEMADVPGESIWNTGAPDTVMDKLKTSSQRDQRVVQKYEGSARINHERVTRVAEELTGGKMD